MKKTFRQKFCQNKSSVGAATVVVDVVVVAVVGDVVVVAVVVVVAAVATTLEKLFCFFLRLGSELNPFPGFVSFRFDAEVVKTMFNVFFGFCFENFCLTLSRALSPPHSLSRSLSSSFSPIYRF